MNELLGTIYADLLGYGFARIGGNTDCYHSGELIYDHRFVPAGKLGRRISTAHELFRVVEEHPTEILLQSRIVDDAKPTADKLFLRKEYFASSGDCLLSSEHVVPNTGINPPPARVGWK